MHTFPVRFAALSLTVALIGCSGGGSSHGGGGLSVAAATSRAPARTAPAATTPPATPLTVSGMVPLAYTLTDPSSNPEDITASYSLDSGKTWQPATEGPGSDGTTALATSPTGVAHTFVWDSLTDLGPVLVPGIVFQIAPSAQSAVVTSPFNVDDRPTTPAPRTGTTPPTTTPPVVTPPPAPGPLPAPSPTPTPAPTPTPTPTPTPSTTASTPLASPATPPIALSATKSKEDALNGNWITVVNGQTLSDDSMIESWTEIGTRLRFQGKVYPLTKTGTSLTNTTATYTDVMPADVSSDPVSLTINLSSTTAQDDTITGTVGTQSVTLTRDVRTWSPLVLTLPGDRPYRMFQIQQLGPAASRDRETYMDLEQNSLDAFLQSCKLYQAGYWQYKYMTGKTLTDQNASFEKMVQGSSGIWSTPRLLIDETQYSQSVTGVLKNSTLAGLALTSFSNYFSVACGRSVRIQVTSDCTIYFVTDRPSRNALIGLVITDTPNHPPLAAPFGRQLLDFGAMPLTDDSNYGKAIMEMMVKSDSSRASQLSVLGRSALTDWYGVMCIEDYRGVAFGAPDLDWGYDMTNVQFYGLVARALARPGQTDSAGNPIMAQVLVGTQLQPGDPSYADVLNGGADMQEYPDMAQLKIYATNYMQQAHPALISAVKDAFAKVVPAAELTTNSQADIFHLICQNLYDSQERMTVLTGQQADDAIKAVTDLLDQLRADSQQFEAYILSQGNTKNNTPAPRSKAP